MPIKVNELIPDFLLPSTMGRKLSPQDAFGKPLVLVFYPADFTPVCGEQLALYQEVFSEYKEYDIHLWGISCDGVWSHKAFADERKISFPLLSDFHPKAHVSRLFNVYHEDDGHSERALFVADSRGVLRWHHVAPIGTNPGADGIIRALEAL